MQGRNVVLENKINLKYIWSTFEVPLSVLLQRLTYSANKHSSGRKTYEKQSGELLWLEHNRARFHSFKKSPRISMQEQVMTNWSQNSKNYLNRFYHRYNNWLWRYENVIPWKFTQSILLLLQMCWQGTCSASWHTQWWSVTSCNCSCTCTKEYCAVSPGRRCVLERAKLTAEHCES